MDRLLEMHTWSSQKKVWTPADYKKLLCPTDCGSAWVHCLGWVIPKLDIRHSHSTNSKQCQFSPTPSTCSESVTIVTPSQLWYSCYSGNDPGPHIILQVELLTPSTSGLPFLLCSPFVLTLLVRKCCLVVLLFCSIVLRSQTYLQSKTPDSLLCSIFWLLCLLCPITVLLSFLFVDTFIPMDTYMNKSCMIGSVCISTIVHPLCKPLVYSIFSISSGVLRNTL